MRDGIPKSPVLLVAYLAKLLAGAAKHPQDGVFPEGLPALIQSTMSEVTSLETAVQHSKGQARQDRDGLRAYLPKAHEVAGKARDAVFLKYGHNNGVLEDFSLRTPRKRSKPAVSAAEKAAKARALADKTRAQLEKAKLRMSRLDAELTRREANAAHAAQALPPEPTPESEPTPPVNGK